MDELCPLCLKMGQNKKIKAVQLNLEEALWMCENEECLWPFLGNEQPTFEPRKVGVKWGYEWQTYRRIKKEIGTIPVSLELSLYTPPVTPSSDSSAKDSAQNVISKNSHECENSTDIFSSRSSCRDSYAPQAAVEACFTKLKNSAKGQLATESGKDCGFNDEPKQVFPSIFDIDSDTFTAEQISINVPIDLGLPDVVSPDGHSAEAVLRKSIPNEPGGLVQKGIPHIRSIARTNIDLQRFEPTQPVKVRKLNTPKVSESLEATSEIKIPDNKSEKHTTTITVDGIPPVTLSYDLSAVESKCENSVPVTSTPIRHDKLPLVLPEHNCEEVVPKKKLRPSVARRAANSAKGLAKFSFNALKKAPVKEPVKLTEPTSNNESSVSSTNDTAEPQKETLIEFSRLCNSDGDGSTNMEVACSTLPESSAADSMNLSCLIDDMLLDNYQNATQNLNDDWLQSFFSDNL